jgi:transcriptional regulator with XRE-family HTH domain
VPTEKTQNPERIALAKSIGERLFLIRKILGEAEGLEKEMPIKLLAQKCGTSASNFLTYENKNSSTVPDSLFLLNLFKATGFTPTWIVSGVEPMRILPPQAESTPAPPMAQVIRLSEAKSDYRHRTLSRSQKEAARIAAQILLEIAEDS